MPTKEEIEEFRINRKEEIYLTATSLVELLDGKIIYDGDGYTWIYPPEKEYLKEIKRALKRGDLGLKKWLDEH